MPLDALFASRVGLISAPDTTWGDPAMQAFEADASVYSSPDLNIADSSVEGPQGPIPVRIYTPKTPKLSGKGLVWFHGGGFAIGGLEMHEAHITAQEIAASTNSVVVSVDYRLVTKERKLPCAQIDGFAAAEWVVKNATSLGIEENKVFVGGASAGACLTGAVALLMRDAELPMAGLLPIYPMAHFVFPPPGDELKAKIAEIPAVLAFSDELLVQINAFAVGENLVEARKYYAFPGDVTDLSGLPPTLIVNCEYDTLRASGELFSKQLATAGVAVSEHLQLGAIHGHLNRLPADCVSMRETLALMTEFMKEN
jgi:acetyl esterase